MGRAFEYRKARKMARWSKMASTFTRISKEIAMAVKASGPNPDTNTRLRIAIQNSKAANMPKDTVDKAIKKASNKDEKNYEEMVYEGYGPHGVAIVVETATDNTTRTVANVRAAFNKLNGSLGTSGSLSFLFDHKVFFKVDLAGLNKDDLELELIDFGLEEIVEEDGETFIQVEFQDYGKMQNALDAQKIQILSADKERIPTTYKEGLSEAQQADVNKLLERLEEDEDVIGVFHNMAE
ncbi:MAG: YebC/PmpR family DNA-binding transcriptional regulator [Bacteroidetes bacterium]|nr:YebC/PmpR family DNA-binding transcriptional regulator [Bacteroidota bacterium]